MGPTGSCCNRLAAMIPWNSEPPGSCRHSQNRGGLVYLSQVNSWDLSLQSFMGTGEDCQDNQPRPHRSYHETLSPCISGSEGRSEDGVQSTNVHWKSTWCPAVPKSISLVISCDLVLWKANQLYYSDQTKKAECPSLPASKVQRRDPSASTKDWQSYGKSNSSFKMTLPENGTLEACGTIEVGTHQLQEGGYNSALPPSGY